MAGPSRKTWGFELSVVILGLLALTQQSMQQSSKHPMHELIQRIHNQGPFFGLVLGSDADERALLANNAFKNIGEIIELAGRKFNAGTINGSSVIYVKAGDGPSINAAITAQLLVIFFAPKGIIHIGRAGTVNDSLSIGDVVVPKEVGFLGNWKWLRGKRGQLVFGEYNTPAPGGNLLGSISFQPTTLYATGKNKTTIFWLPLTSDWLEAASQLENLELEQCISKDKCLPKAPVILNGLRASSSDIYIQNKAYREFIYKQFKASTVDTQSAAEILVALSSDVPIIVFTGISNTAGGSSSHTSFSDLASVNAVKAAVAFIAAVGNSNSSLEVADN
ncbi:bark storage protein B-like [Manihot esculenta]|uniref:Nucleoside phosphorylase domain-containing protein n=2 Tax=Manihot esculenta TaxID=3983 RepID=A0A2C9VAG4_MANES|nr:bark storage protein B [Manihot esculenta]XP_043815924.1 bark storage protein B-like [Manihot esculenta]KAG8647921.1 hypothetical protein MANES_09G126050v8 [Manihot esculenta]OAY41742.1 hypothetical protein MANES_09G126000v8 [Manihot esculenta]